jgi:hypothetical protein
MKRKGIHLPSPAMIVAIIALIVALGSGAYAAKIKLGKNTVTTKAIKNNAVIEKKIANGAVTEKKIANEAVTEQKLAPAVRGAAVAWADVAANGTVTAGRGITSGNISASNGFYCFHGVPDVQAISVTPAWTGDEFGSFAIATVSKPASADIGCVAGSQFAVVTQFFNIATDSAPYSPRAFTIVLNK